MSDTGVRWREEARCFGSGIDFVSERHVGGIGPDPVHEAAVADALVMCGACPARERCLSFAMDAERGKGLPHRVGVWGGTTPGERWLADQPRQHGAQNAVRAGCQCAECRAWAEREVKRAKAAAAERRAKSVRSAA